MFTINCIHLTAQWTHIKLPIDLFLYLFIGKLHKISFSKKRDNAVKNCPKQWQITLTMWDRVTLSARIAANVWLLHWFSFWSLLSDLPCSRIHNIMWDKRALLLLWQHFASGIWHFHHGAHQFGILVSYHELDFKQVWRDAQQEVCH